MPFDRRFGRNPESILKLSEVPWGRHLLGLWCPAGSTTGRYGLRLAIRNGTLNFYRRGQSVAKVGFDRAGQPVADLHLAYVTGQTFWGQPYARLSGDRWSCAKFPNHLGHYGSERQLQEWVERADAHRGAEKAFVDDLVANNPNVIDLEMGLPAFINALGAKTAPRMDLVALELRDGRPVIVFWEAKMMENGELRSRSDPKIIRQLEDYRSWLNGPGRRQEVAAAYQASCRLQVTLHSLARQINPDIADLGALVRRVALSNSELGIDPAPRVVVSDLRKDRSWIEHLHSDRLHKEGISVHLVQNAEDLSLPGCPA